MSEQPPSKGTTKDRLPESLRDPIAVLKRGQDLHEGIIERRLIVAIQEADRKFEAAGVGGTKTYVRGFLMPALEKQGIKLDTTI